MIDARAICVGMLVTLAYQIRKEEAGLIGWGSTGGGFIRAVCQECGRCSPSGKSIYEVNFKAEQAGWYIEKNPGKKSVHLCSHCW